MFIEIKNQIDNSNNNVFKEIFNNTKTLKRTELLNKYIEMAKVSKSTANRHINKAIENKIINKINNMYQYI